MWNVPVDHELFDRISGPQWLWYFFNYSKDQDEEFERSRDFVEYHASFIEPQAVQKLREARQNTVRVGDKDFADIIKSQFGRDVALNNSRSGGTIISSNLNAALDNVKKSNEMKSNLLKSDYWKSLE